MCVIIVCTVTVNWVPRPGTAAGVPDDGRGLVSGHGTSAGGRPAPDSSQGIKPAFPAVRRARKRSL
jgi:hypothetical protein